MSRHCDSMVGMRRYRFSIANLCAISCAIAMAPAACAQFLPAVTNWSSFGSSTDKLRRSGYLHVSGGHNASSSASDTKNSNRHQKERSQRVSLPVPRMSAQGQLIAEGDAARDNGEYDRASQIYRYAQRQNPHDSVAFARDAEVLYRLGRNSEAHEKAVMAVANNVTNGDALLILAESLLACGENDRALKILEKASVVAPMSKTVFRLLGDIYGAGGSTDKADAAFAKVLEIDSNDVHAATNIAAHLAGCGHVREAISICKQVAPPEESPTLQNQLGLLHLQQHELSQAVDHFKLARDADPHDPLSFEMLSIISGARQDWPGAQDFAQSFCDIDRNNINAMTMLAWATYASGELQDSRLAFQRAIAVKPDCPAVHELYALVLMDSLRYTDAAAELKLGTASGDGHLLPTTLIENMNDVMLKLCQEKYKEAANEADDLLGSHSDLASVLSLCAYSHYFAGDGDKARELASRALQHDHLDCLAHVTLAKLEGDAGRYDLALEQLNAAGAGWRNTSLILTERAKILYQAGKYEQAQSAAQMALQISPTSSSAKQVLAFTLSKQGNWDGASLFLKELVGRNSKNLGLRLALADALEHKGDLDGAERAYEAAMKIDNKAPQPLVGLARLAMHQGNHIRARQYAEKAARLDPECLNAEADRQLRRLVSSRLLLRRKAAN